MSPSISRLPSLTLNNGSCTLGEWVACYGGSKGNQRVGIWKIGFRGWSVSSVFLLARTCSTLRAIYSVRTQLQKHVHVLFVFKNSFELANVLVLGSLMELDLGQHLHNNSRTFCRALGFSNTFLCTIFKANFFLSPILSTSKHSANPPTWGRRYLCRDGSVWGTRGTWWSRRSSWSSNARSSVQLLL